MNKLLAALVLFFCQLLTANCQPADYWQQQVNYTINVSLNDKEHSLQGFEKIEYINNSPDTLTFIWFHIWPNAYKTDKTAFSDQLLENGNTKFYFSSKEQKGYINRLDFKVNDITAKTEDHPLHIDIIKLLLSSPLLPGQKTIITTPFNVKLPYNFSRGGHDGDSYQITQWYPKPAVYDKIGWHPMPYLDQGEFYSEFGSFDVSITVPENYVVAATGELQNDPDSYREEKKWLKERSTFTWTPVKKRIKKGSTVKTVIQRFPVSSTDIKTLRFKQDKVHDFAWFADKRFIVDHDTCQLLSGKIIDVYSYYTPAAKKYWSKSISYSKDAIRTRSQWIGEYSYNVVSVVQGPESFGGGMEYPTITVISPEKNVKILEYTIAHEISHNWFYGVLGSNERQYPWMDEGFNTYYDNRYSEWKHGAKGEFEFGAGSVPIKNIEKIGFETMAAKKKDQPINTPSEELTQLNYGLVAYYKTGAWLEYAESIIGKEAFDKAMQEYYRQWQFKHPQPEDFKKVLETTSGKSLDSAFALLDKKGTLPNQQRTGSKVYFFPGIKTIPSAINSNIKNTYTVLPSAGIDYYDKFMIGLMIHNIKLPTTNFQFFLAPMYATGSKKFAGLGFVNYSFYPEGFFHKIKLGLAGSAFSMNSFKDDAGKKSYTSFYKVVPSIKLTLKEKTARSTLNRFIQFKTFLIGEEAFNFYRDTSISPQGDTTIMNKVRIGNENRTLNQLKIISENNRALYPYRYELRLEQGKSFIRTSFTGNYFFNYARGGGLDVRLFAGKFFYTSPKTFTKQFETDRYHLNMTGPNGYEDYTYSDYFIGRNEFEGLASQQIMVRDGAFKVRTELLADKVGKTDDWLMAVNFSTTIPPNINPLNVLPIKIPVKIFADIGTYADAWKKNSTEDRFLFDAGIHIPILKETINIYIPLLYSKVYKDYIKTTLDKKNRFLKTISFSIDISNFSLRKFSNNFAD